MARRVTTPRAVVIAGAALAVTVALGIFVVVPTAKGLCALPSTHAFDAATWQADDGDWPCTDRAGMLPAVLDDVLEMGMTEQGVRDLLGPPASAPALAWPDRDALIWKVRCGIDCEWLVATLRNGQLTSVEVASD